MEQGVLASVERRGGRPRKLPEDKQKVVFHLAPDEVAALDRYAAARTLSRADVIRQMLRLSLRGVQGE